MPLVDGLYLNKYVDPQLLVERRNYRAEFMTILGSVPQGAITADGIRRNKLINNVGFRVNNTEEFEAKAMTGQNVIITWETYDTEPTSCTDDEIRNLSFDKRAVIRTKHNESFQVGIRNHILHKLAPKDNTIPAMPVLVTTGDDDGSGRLRLCFVDLVNLSQTVKEMNLPVQDQFYVVLSPQHMTDLLLDKNASKYFYDRTFYADPITGKPRAFMGLKFYENNDTPYYDPETKKIVAEGTIPTKGTHFQASTFFYAPNTYYYLQSVKSLYKPETTDTRSVSPTSEYRTQTYGIVDRIEDFGMGAIVSAKATAVTKAMAAARAAKVVKPEEKKEPVVQEPIVQEPIKEA